VTVRIERYDGGRAALRPLFELAEDSASTLDGYLDEGRVLVARRGTDLVGHLQLVPTGVDGEVELKNMAVVPEHRATGVGRALVERALAESAADGCARMLVATGAADVGNLRFYQRLGFRMLSVERDAFVPETGYPDPIVIDGIPLRDRVWLSQDLNSHHPDLSEPHRPMGQ
jgi:GNAT superfamily N-acetyltransferase